MRIVPEHLQLVESGDRFGRLTVIGVPFYATHGTILKRMQTVVAHCMCGSIIAVRVNNLRTGTTESCGCVGKERMSAMGKTKPGLRHGESHTRLYRIWDHMLGRCRNPLHQAFSSYGGRGISVCPEWKNYERFRDWAVTHGYAAGLSIDRYPDNDGNYEPGNCRWATKTEQANNKRCNRKYTHNGLTLSIAEWGRLLGRPWTTLSRQLLRYPASQVLSSATGIAIVSAVPRESLL